MPCYKIGNAIVCTRVGIKPTPRCACGKPRTRECDWRLLRYVGKRGETLKKPRQVTCDEPLCDDCTFAPAEGKDLCGPHRAKWEARLANPPPPATTPAAEPSAPDLFEDA